MYMAYKMCITKLGKVSRLRFLVHKTRHSAQLARCTHWDNNETTTQLTMRQRENLYKKNETRDDILHNLQNVCQDKLWIPTRQGRDNIKRRTLTGKLDRYERTLSSYTRVGRNDISEGMASERSPEERCVRRCTDREKYGKQGHRQTQHTWTKTGQTQPEDV